MLRLLAGLLMAACLTPVYEARAEPLVVLYFERPPYYFTENGRPSGFLVDLAREILTAADIEHEFQEMPAKRILETIKSSPRPICSIGWFRTAEREAYSIFSLPIYQDLPLQALFLKSGGKAPTGKTTFARLAQEPGLLLGLNASFSYGPAVDAVRSSLASQTLPVNASQEQLMRMLAARRFDYMLVNPEEIDTLAELAGIDAQELVAVRLEDVPKGNRRYIMFGKATPESLVEQVNEAVRQVVGTP